MTNRLPPRGGRAPHRQDGTSDRPRRRPPAGRHRRAGEEGSVERDPTSEPRRTLFEAIREACYPATWSRGVELCRLGAVVDEPTDDPADEVAFRITTRGGMICPKVQLFPDDLDWECECRSRESVCAHVAAAVIAWHRSSADEAGTIAPAVAAGRVGYRFQRTDGGVALDRVIVGDGAAVALETTLAAVAEGRVAGPRFIATQEDLAVELALGTHRRGLLPARLVARVFSALSGCRDVTLDGSPVGVEAAPVLPLVQLRDQGEGYLLRLVRDPLVREVFGNGIALREDTLRPIGDPRLSGAERHHYGRGRYFSPDEVADLVTQVLPSLRRRLPVELRTDRLPATVDEAPRVWLELSRAGRRLCVLGTLVYGDPPLARVDGGRLVHLQGPVPLRNERAERKELRRLEQLGLVAGVRCELEGEAAVAFNTRLEAWTGRISGSGREHFALAPPLVPRVVTGERFDVVFECAGDAGASAAPARGRRADPAEVLRAWRAGESLVPLLDGGWAPIPREWLARVGPRVADLLAARDDGGRLPPCWAGELAALCEDLGQTPPAECLALRRLAHGFEGLPSTTPPADLAVSLRPYQRRGVDWLVFLREAGLGALLGDDMGLGKTLQALCALRAPALVVAPTSVLHNWADEIRAHRPALRFGVYHGARRELDPDLDVVLTSYAILRLDAERLSAPRWATVILDESQNIKNPGSQVTAAACGLQAGFRLALTGTPIENRLEELWSQFHFLNRGLLGGRREFAERWVEPISRGDEGAAERLRERIRPFLLRRLKSEVARELPPRTEMVLYCELSDGEREVYETVRAATREEIVRRLQTGANALAALEALLRLRQAACHAGLVPGQQAADSSKLRVLLDALGNVIDEGHKALVFSQWTSLLDLTEPHLERAGIRHVRLDGSTRNRAEVVRTFQESADVPLMLISLKAGGTGLNLTAADHIFLLDPWWNPAVEDQAADRAHRIGQQRPVMVYRLVAENTVEERVVELQRHKRELAEIAVGGADRASALTRDDLLRLLD